MTDKYKLRIANKALDKMNAKTKENGSTEQSNAHYLSKLEIIYKIESETIFKSSEKRERFVRI